MFSAYIELVPCQMAEALTHIYKKTGQEELTFLESGHCSHTTTNPSKVAKYNDIITMILLLCQS